MIISKGTKLFRYCLGDNMPLEWTTHYHSPEYHSPVYGEKNQIGAFFFYCDEVTARNVLNAAIKKAVSSGKKYNRITITTCQTIADLNLLDLTRCVRPVQVLNVLFDNDIDVLTTNFYKYLEGTKVPFCTIRDCHKYIMDNERTKDRAVKNEINNRGNKIDNFFLCNMGYLLTDFNNGHIFKEQLLDKGYEGYRFMEERSSSTICIFDSSKLSAPCHTIV